MKSFASYLENECRVSGATITAYVQSVRLFEAFLPCPLEQATDAHLFAYIRHLKSGGRANATVLRALSALCAFYKYAIQIGLCTENPVQAIPRPEADRKLPIVLTADEVHALLESPKGSSPTVIRDRAILELLYATGITVSELIALNLDHVNLRRRMLTVRKSGGGRTVPFGRPCSRALDAYIKTARPYLLSEEMESALFVNYNGARLSRQGLWKLMKKYKEQAGIDKEITPHMLRHSFASHLLEHGADLASIGEMLGVSDPASTAVYTQIVENKILDVYKKAHPRS